MQATLQKNASVAVARANKGVPCGPAAMPRLPAQVARVAGAPQTIRIVPNAVADSTLPPMDNRKRWDAQIRDGRVRNIGAADVAAMINDGWTILDVRPPTETSKAAIKGAVAVPLFVPDTATDAAAFIKKATDFAMGSWWLGGTHYVPNDGFLAEVQAKIPKDARVIVACQKGLRSLAACEQLARAGYQQLAWINGGLDTARKGNIETVDGKDIRYGGIGGLSETIGWTEVQREENQSSFLGGLEGVIKLFSIILVADLLLFIYEQVNYWQSTGTGPFGK